MRREAASPRLTILYLGDEEMRRYYVQKFAEDPVEGRGFLTRSLAPSGDPELVTMLAPYLFLEEPAAIISTPDVGDVIGGRARVSVEACDAIGQIIGNSPDFNGELVDWARQVVNARNWPAAEDLERWREMWREWWRANEAAFKAKDYRAVRPGRFSPGGGISKPDWATRLGPAPENQSAAPAATAPAPNAPGATTPAVARFDPTLWILGSLTHLAAIACGWMLWRRKR